MFIKQEAGEATTPATLPQIVEAYRNAARNIRNRVRMSRFKAKWFMEGVGLGKSPSAYYRRMHLGEWTPEQLLKFAYLLDGQTVPVNLK